MALPLYEPRGGTYTSWTMTRERLQALLTEYGRVALYVYFILFAVVLSGFALAITLGFEVASATSGAGVLGAAWVATKLTQPLRILATLLLTPVVARVLGKRPAATAQSGNEPSRVEP